jgi:hypothetical protein
MTGKAARRLIKIKLWSDLNPENHQGDKAKRSSNAGIGLVFGAALGAAVGMLFSDYMALFAGIGTALGLLVGAMADTYAAGNNT